jgi:alpha-mannosidase
LLPSTHHDYVTGTASDFVYQFEQLPLLATAHREALGAANDALAALTASVGPLEATNLVVIANPAGVSFTGAVDLPGPLPPGMKGIQFGNSTNAVQPTNAGGLLFLATIDSLGYTTGTLTAQPGSLSNPAGISTPDLGNSYILKNQYLTVTVARQSSWGISAISDSFGNSLLNSSGVGNQLVFYNDGGDIYGFGNEYPGFNFAVDPVTFETSDATMLEQGPVRVRLKTVVSVTIGSTPWTYVREYCLVAGEPFLRMTTTGAAPKGYSIMTSFDLAQAVQSIVRGTPCHWTAVQPLAMWPAPVFQASHHFLIPEGEAGPLAVIYHPEVPGWSYDGHGVLLGCLLRNTPAQNRGAFGSDSASHTLRYALRTPTGLGDPTTGQPLMEALTYVMPPSAAFRPAYPSYNANTTPPNPPSPLLPQSGSLASVDPPGVILAAKPGDVEPGTLVLRIYQPTNSPQTLTVTLGKRPREVIAVTALEDPIVTGAPAIRVTETGFTIDVKTALNTVQIRK